MEIPRPMKHEEQPQREQEGRNVAAPLQAAEQAER